MKKDVFQNNSIKVPFVLPEITADDKKVILRMLKNSLLTDGPKLQEFETKFAKFSGAKYAIGVSNATAGLHLSLNSLGIGKGDEVIIPDMTFVATANAVLLTGATPVIADVNMDDFCISINSIKKSITKKTKAILPVHFAGRPCEMSKIFSIAKKHSLKIIEDCAHGIGARIKRNHVGTFGDVGCFSFYPTKNITTFEGGMIITDSKKIMEFVKSARNHGVTRTLRDRFAGGKPWDYDVKYPGYNYRLDEIRSSLGINQLKRINRINSRRKKACEYYNSKLAKINGIVIPKYPTNQQNSFHLYVLRIQKQFGLSRDKLFHKFLKNGIRTSVHYKPLHKFTAYKRMAKVYDRLHNSSQIYNEIITLPLFPQISKKQQNVVIDNIIH
jgi:dTDP-4-amino-4,6-dideoxygalactose transaminase